MDTNSRKVSEMPGRGGINSLLAKGGVQNNLGNIENKEQNLKNIEKIQENQKASEKQMTAIKDQFSSLGQKISESMSADKLREIENREKEKEQQRNQKEREMNEFMIQVKTEKRVKKQEFVTLEVEVVRVQQQLQISQEQLQKQQKQQTETLAAKDQAFTETMDEKERYYQELLKQLAACRQKCKEEKEKLDKLEDLEDDVEEEREKYMAELERLDEELDTMDDEEEDQDLLLASLQQEARELQIQIAFLDDEIRKKKEEIEQLKNANLETEQRIKALQKEIDEKSAQCEDIDELQRALQDLMDQEKKLFEQNVGLMNDLKACEMESQEGNSKNQELEELINRITEHNYAERKSRAVEKLIRDFEDKLRDKRRIGQDIQRKIVRVNDLIGQQGTEYLKQFGCDTLKDKLDRFEIDVRELEKEKEFIRAKKQKVDAQIVGKDIKEITNELLQKSLQGLRDVEREIDTCNQKENDILLIDRLKKQFQDIEKEIALDFQKKTSLSKTTQEKRIMEYNNRAEVILNRCKQIETDILPNMSKIADDEDEIEILKGKHEILKQIRRSANDLINLEIEENTNPKLVKMVLKKDNAYEIIEQFNELQDVELEVNGIEKDLCQIEKRLHEYEQGLKQFEVDLKVDFYEDSIREAQEQNQRVRKLDQQIKSLNDGIAAIEEAIQQAQSGHSTMGEKQEELMNLQEMLEKLKDKRNELEKIKKQLAKDGSVLQSDLNDVNIEDISPDTLEKLDIEIVRLRDITDGQEKLIQEVLGEMKKVKDNSQQLAFKKKADKRQECKQKLKKIKDNTDELDRILSEIGGTIDMIWKDAKYLKESEFSPTKNRPSLMFGQSGGDKEKEIEVQKQYKDLESKEFEFEDLRKEKEKLKKQINQFQEKYDQLPLESSSLVDYEGLIDAIQVDLDERSVQMKDKGKNLLEVELKKLKDDVEALIERFKQKKQVLADCRKEEKEKLSEVQRIESQLNGYKLRVGCMERELMNQQSMNFKTNQEKKEMSQQYLKDSLDLKGKVAEKIEEIENQKKQLKIVTADLDQIGEKIVSLDTLKQIYKQLLEFKKLQALKDELRQLGEQISQKENQVESFIKDILGGSQYECERKLKEAEALMDKLQKKIIELNNGMNDFDIELKKGQLQNNDDEILKEGKRLQDQNTNDRKGLKNVEDQKNLVRKVLQKIKNSLNDLTQHKSGDSPKPVKVSGAELEEMIAEIETCMKKGDSHWTDLENLDVNLERRKEEWSKCMFKTGAKDALVDDIEKSLKDNITSLEDLEGKLKDIDKVLRGFNEVCQAMKGNPDYETRQAYVQKQIELNQEQKKKRDEIEKEKNALLAMIKKQKEAKACGLKNLSLEELQQLAKDAEEANEKVGQQNQESDTLLKDLQKRRQKLGDADILDNFKNRVEVLNELDTKIKDIERDQKELEKVIQESAKMNPKGAQEATKQFAQITKDINQCLKDKENLQKKLLELKEKIKIKDLNRDDPFTFIPLIEEIKNVQQQLNSIDEQSNKLEHSMTFLRNKYGGVDVDKKVEQFQQSSQEFRKLLNNLLEDIEVLRELCFEFDGYTSDAQEEDFIERLGVDLKEIGAKHNIVNEESEQLNDAITAAQKNLQRKKEKEGDSQKSLSLKEIEEKAQLVSQLEEQHNKTKKLVDDLTAKVNKHKKVFMAMQTKEKLRRRQQEVIELNKRLEQFESQLNEIEVDMQSEANKIKIGAEGGEELMKLFESMFVEINGIKLEYVDIGQKLIVVNDEISEVRDSKMHQFEQLKGNIQIKKKILNYLQSVKQVRSQYAQLKNKYETNKPKKQVTYQAAKGDHVDQLLAEWLNNNSCPVPIKRMGGGYYMFGTKKIYAKIINGKLVIRVGGGYMSIDEFMFYYGAQELNKMIAYEAVEDNDEIDLDQALDGNNNQGDLIKHRGDGKSVIGIAQMKKRLSPRQPSPRIGSPSAQAQIKRSAQGQASPRVGSPRNVAGSRTESGRSGEVVGRSMQMSGRRSPDGGGQSFLKKTVQKRTTEYTEEQVTYKKTEKVEMIMNKEGKPQGQ